MRCIIVLAMLHQITFGYSIFLVSTIAVRTFWRITAVRLRFYSNPFVVCETTRAWSWRSVAFIWYMEKMWKSSTDKWTNLTAAFLFATQWMSLVVILKNHQMHKAPSLSEHANILMRQNQVQLVALSLTRNHSAKDWKKTSWSCASSLVQFLETVLERVASEKSGFFNFLPAVISKLVYFIKGAAKLQWSYSNDREREAKHWWYYVLYCCVL